MKSFLLFVLILQTIEVIDYLIFLGRGKQRIITAPELAGNVAVGVFVIVWGATLLHGMLA